MSHELNGARWRDMQHVRCSAETLLEFAEAVTPDADFGVGYMLAESIAAKVEGQNAFHQIVWLIEILGDCSSHLAATLRDEYPQSNPASARHARPPRH